MLKAVRQLESNLEQVAREIYYAMSLVGPQENLLQALKLLGVVSPRDVGLSESVRRLRRDKDEWDR